jgi:N-acetylneuraminic acid mutarotase
MTELSGPQLTDARLERMLLERAGRGAPADLVDTIAQAVEATGQRAPGPLGAVRATSRPQRTRGRRWLLVAAMLAVGTGVVGASLVGGRLIAPDPSPTTPVAVVDATAVPSPDPSASVVPYRAPSWTATGTAARPLTGSATLLRDGRVLVAGGSDFFSVLGVAQLYDPDTGTWTVTGSMVTARQGPSATLLPDGNVLVVGGTADDGGLLASAELYDPGTGSWATTGSLHEARSFHTATLLADGTVLVAGGNTEPNVDHPSLASAELYDPGTGTWTATGSMGSRRTGAPATLLLDGRVLVVGGDDFGNDTLASAELYDPGTATWTATGSMHEVRAGHSVTLLHDGKVLVAGGVDNMVDTGGSASAELYDPGTGTWAATGTMQDVRARHSATLLRDGRVLVTGGSRGWTSDRNVDRAELYDPGSGTWARAASMVNNGTSATLLLDGRVLVVGGGDGGAEAELYDPGSGTPPSFPTTPEPSPSMSPTLVACGNPGPPAGPATGTPGWILTGTMTTARSQHHATLLPDGRVLVTGGSGPRRVGVSLAPPLSAELYEPATRTWTATQSMRTSRTGHTATLLPDGRVLVIGGYDADRDFASAELYDPASGTWTATGSMIKERRYHTATLLLDGRVLVAGGMGNGPDLDVLAAAELYDPRTGTWTATRSMVTPRVYHQATLLADGRVLLIGGIKSGPEGGPTVADLYDPRSGRWTTIRAKVSPAQGDSSTLLPDGRLLVVGGSSGTSAQLFDPNRGSWAKTGSMGTPRRFHTATLLSDGTVLVTGGEYEATPACTSAERYDPGSGSWTTAPSLLVLRSAYNSNYTATLLDDGTVLVAGGDDNGALASAELYDPGRP